MQNPDDPFYRARGYPYLLPPASYVMRGTSCRVADHSDPLPGLRGRRPVLATGSNMSPEQLGRKFPDADSIIPVTRVRLRGFDTVFSAHFTRYGAIPATLFPSPGTDGPDGAEDTEDTEVTLFITWLDHEQERHMHSTEIASENYRFCRLNDLRMRVDNGPVPDHVYVYLSSRGAVSRNGVPVPLAAVPARNRRRQAMSQDDIQDHARRMLVPHQPLDDFIRENIDDAAIRRQRTDRLHETALPFRHRAMEVVET